MLAGLRRVLAWTRGLEPAITILLVMVWVFVAIVAAMGLSHAAPFPFVLDAASADRVIWRMPARGRPPAMYLTFDDGPNPVSTPPVLDALKAQQGRATFFLIEKYVTGDTAPIVRRMFDEGHGVALHSDNRWQMASSPDDTARVLTAFADRVERLTGSRPCRAFRPHAGVRSRSLLDGLGRIDHQMIGWGFMGWDWNWFRKPTADALVPRFVKRASDGFIVVIHDSHHKDPSKPRAYAAETAARLVPALREKGFTLRTICEDLPKGPGPNSPKTQQILRTAGGEPAP
jgi:peptidoglycan/xylan/chitin deacetylase (PgdA/CDA1 family)